MFPRICPYLSCSGCIFEVLTLRYGFFKPLSLNHFFLQNKVLAGGFALLGTFLEF